MAVINIRTEIPGPNSRALMRRRETAVPRGVAHSVRVCAASAAGATVTDVDGNVYLDFAGGIGVMNVGHSQASVVAAVREQAERFTHVGFSVLPYEPYISLAERLARVAPGAFPKKTLLVNSGAEAIENAVKIARHATGRPGVLCVDDAFHGRTLLALSLTSKAAPYKLGYAPFASDVVRVPFAYCYRCACHAEYPSCEFACVDEIERQFSRYVDPRSIAAIVVEPVLGEGGFVVPPPGYLSKLEALCRRHGILVIADEVQTGFGRTGRLFACEHDGVEPDLLVTAKSLAAGLPLAAVIGRADLMDGPVEGGLGGTYCGNPLACAAAHAVLDLFESGQLLQRSEAIGARIETVAKRWAATCPLIGDVRRRGAMVGIELVRNRETREPAKHETDEIVRLACERGVILIAAGTFGNVIRFLSPLTITDDELDEGLDALSKCFTAVAPQAVAPHAVAPPQWRHSSPHNSLSTRRRFNTMATNPKTAASPSVATIPLWIGGGPVQPQGVASGDVMNPTTGRVIRRVPFAGAVDIDRAVRAAAGAYPGWRATPPLRRARILTRFRELLSAHQAELAALISEEHGKVFQDAMGSVQRGIEVVEFVSGAAHLLKGEFAESVGRDVDAYSRRQPLGVCVGITPFNFPAMVPMWMFPVALACGNTFVLKPSERDPSASVRMAGLLKEAGLPDGVFNVVHGDKTAVDALLTHPDVTAVSFVGSTPVARHVYATCAAAGKRVQALGGAKNHAVVLPDADLAFAADAIVGAAYGSAGERCMALSAVVAVGGIGDALVAALAERARALRVGPSHATESEMGPLITATHRKNVVGYIDTGVREGAQLIVDGRTLTVSGYEEGFFLGPTLFDHVSPDMTIYREEIFGPVLVVLRARTLDDAITVINACRFGNGTAIFTSSGAAARHFEESVDVGMVGINVAIPVPMAFFSFGGWNQSLFGDLHVYGADGIRFYTRTKAITSRWPVSSSGTGGMHMPTLG